jgi:hypothetical protein
MLNILRSERGFSVSSGMLAAAGVSTILAASFVYSEGLIRVSVHENRPGGDHIRFAVPGAIVPIALAFVPARIIGEHMPIEAKQHLPVVQAALSELKKLPDCTLVEVEGPDEHVQIQVRDGQFVVDVHDRSDEVHLTVPLSSVESAMSKVIAAAQYAGTGDDEDGWSHAWRHSCSRGAKDPDSVTWEEDDSGANPTEETAELQ